MSDEYAADVVDDGHRLLAELERDLPAAASARGECRPLVDIIETAATVEIVADLPGLSPAAVRVGFRHNVLIVAGAKLPTTTTRPLRVHVVERSYGRFIRLVRINAAIDVTAAHATMQAGQLRIVVPRVADRRGHFIEVPVERSA